MTQLARLLTYLERNQNGITTLEASDKLRICRLSERVRELEALNYVIEHRAEKTPNARVIRYVLIQSQSIAA